MAKHWETWRLRHWSAPFPDTLSKVVAKTNAETLICVEAKAPR